MTDKAKPKSPRNRTVAIQPEERDELRQAVSAPACLVGGEWKDRLIKANLADCLPLIPDGTFDLAIIDPPYNLDRQFGNSRFTTMTTADYEDYLRSWFYPVCDKLKPSGSLYMCGDWRSTASMQRVIAERLTILNRITWQREKGRGSKRNWKNSMEDIWFAVKDARHYHFDLDAVKLRRRVIAPYRDHGIPKDWDETPDGKYRMTCPSNFWDDISVPFWSMPENTDHPTQKPEKLYAKLILASSRPGDLVFDPFAGSGTAAVVAKKLGRHYCSIEREAEYCLWAAKRLAMADTDKTIQGYADGVFKERNS